MKHMLITSFEYGASFIRRTRLFRLLFVCRFFFSSQFFLPRTMTIANSKCQTMTHRCQQRETMSTGFFFFFFSFLFSRIFFVSLLKWEGETRDENVSPMPDLTSGTCSMQLSCEHPKTPAAAAVVVDGTIPSMLLTSFHTLFLFRLSYLCDEHACCSLIITNRRLTLHPVCRPQ